MSTIEDLFASGRPRRPRRWLYPFLIGCLALIAGFTTSALFNAFHARAELRELKVVLEGARQAAVDGNITALERAIKTGRRLANSAVAHARSPVIRLVGTVPFAGRSARSLITIAESARMTTEAVQPLLRATQRFPKKDGTVSFGPLGGEFDPSPWTLASPDLDAAAAALERSEQRALESPDTWLLPGMSQSRTDLLERLRKARRAVDLARSVAVLLPQLVGDKPRTHLLLFQNPAEGRATGGLIGGYALIETRNGKAHLARVGPDTELVEAKKDVDMPDWFRARYDRYKTRRLWLDANMEPDFPTTGSLLAGLFQATNRVAVDTVIATDPQGLAEILAVTGPVPGPKGTTLTAESIARLIMHDEYLMFPKPEQTAERKAFFVDAASAIWKRLLDGVDVRDAARALARSGTHRHLFMWSPEGSVQSQFVNLGIAGSFRAPGESFVGVVTQNASGNKVDYFLTRKIDVNIRVQPDASIRGRVTIKLHNAAPSSGLPQYVLGPHVELPKDPPGLDRTILSIYLPRTAIPRLMKRDAQPQPHEVQLAPDAAIASVYLKIPSGTSTTIDLAWTQPRVLTGSGRERELVVNLLRQPTAHPDSTSLTIEGPKGFRLTASGASSSRSEVLRFQAPAQDANLVASIRLHRPLWGRFVDLWRRIGGRRDTLETAQSGRGP